jgi:hypothetical protein
MEFYGVDNLEIQRSGAAARGVDDALAKAKSSNNMDELDDSLPPSARTAKFIARRLGGNRAGRYACMAIASGEKLTRQQKKAVGCPVPRMHELCHVVLTRCMCWQLFRLGHACSVDPRAMVSIVKQTDGIGVTPMELEVQQLAATKAGLPTALVRLRSRRHFHPHYLTRWLCWYS